MVAGYAFKKDLALIDKDYFPFWNDRLGRWEIRWWRGVHRKGDEEKVDIVLKNSRRVLVVAKRDEEGRDIGYHPLDNRVLLTMKLRTRLSEESPEKILRDIDRANEELANKKAEETEDIIRQASATAWNASHRIWSK